MKPGELDAIAGGYHGDPFSLLGPHEDGEGWIVRALLPQAGSATVRTSTDELVPMERVHPGGVWEARLDESPGCYRIAMELQRGGTEEIEDPYRFSDLLSDFDIYLHAEGTNYAAWHSMGAHLTEVEGVRGCRFAVWAPNAEMVGVCGDFNQWDPYRHPMRHRNNGLWELFIPSVHEGDIYKYFVRSKIYGVSGMKCDPYGFGSEKPPKQGSVVWDLSRYQWNDQEWMEHRGKTQFLERPVSCYEVHVESWMRSPEGEPLTYREMAAKLVPYVKHLGFTHIELMPIMEHPYSGSWGYQVVGYFSPTARFGSPDDFRFFIDECHRQGIAVIVDWVPAHFPKDAHGLARFDGTSCYEHDDPRIGEHKGWGTLIFNFGRNEVRNFLISNAMFWLKEYHIDGLRVDAVASMLYLDYDREQGEWLPNKYGGRENIEAIDFIRRFNEEAHTVPGAVTIAEESTSFAGVSHPVYLGGLGFTMKWNMGWMHDMFAYFKSDPLFRRYNHNHVTFSLVYAFTENFLLPISHDEVVHGKSSLIGKMPGDDWQRFANVRAFLGYMYGHPGKKLLFMGCELGQYEEWNWQGQIRWDLLQYAKHRGLQDYVRELNFLYQNEASLYEVDYHWKGFEWVDFHDLDGNVISFIRRAKNPDNFLLFVCSFAPQVRHGYHVGVPRDGVYQEILCSDAPQFGGSGVQNHEPVRAQQGQVQGKNNFIAITLPPLGVSVFRRVWD